MIVDQSKSQDPNRTSQADITPEPESFSPSKAAEAADSMDTESTGNAPPPSYDASTSGPSISAVPKPPKQRAVNYYLVDRPNGRIKADFLVDPFLRVPVPMMPPLDDDETEETRHHLKLKSNNGGITADVWIVGNHEEGVGRNDGVKKPLRLCFQSNNATIVATVRVATETGARIPMQISCLGKNSSINVYLPRDFRGPLFLRTVHGSVKYSDELAAHITNFSEANHERRAFLGNYDDWDGTLESWQGDQARLDTSNSLIKVSFADEVSSTSASSGGFFNKLFGR